MSVYVFYGEEDFLREYNAGKIIKECNLSNPDMNFVKLSDENIEKIIDNCEQLPFFDDKKIVYVKGSGFFSGNKKISASTVEKVVKYLETAPDYVEIIFNEESVDKRLSPYKKLSKVAKFEEFKFRGEVDLANWICGGMKKCGGSIDIETAKYLAEACGPSMSYLYSEIKKLAILSKEGEVINRELIDDVAVKSVQGIIFDLTDAIGLKDKPRALLVLEELILKKEAEQFILIMLYKHFRNLFLIKVAMNEGCASADYLGINPYVYKKLLSQVKKYTEDEIREIMAKFTEFDYKSKRGEIDLRTGIESVICCL